MPLIGWCMVIEVPPQHQTDPAKKAGQIVTHGNSQYFAVPYTGSAYKPAVAHVTAQEKTLVASINEYKESEAYRLGYEAGSRDMYDRLTTPLFSDT